MPQLRVLQVHNRPRQPGGADRMVQLEHDVLSAHGHTVEQWLIESGSLSGIRAAGAAVWNRPAGRRLASAITAFDPDIIHLHTPFPVLSAAAIDAFGDRPVVHTVHGYRWSCVAGTHYRDGSVCHDCTGRRLPTAAVAHRCYHDSAAASLAMVAGLGAHRLRRSLQRFDRIITFSETTAELLVRSGCPSDRLRIVPNFVEDPGSYRPVGDGSALFLGRLTREKGVRTLVEAWTRERRREGLPLRIAGDGPLAPWVEAVAADHDHIEYLGWCDREQAGELLAAASCLVFPSEWYEGMPLSILEALARGVPVLASDVGNFHTMIDPGGTGHLFTNQDPVDLARLADDLAADLTGLDHLRAACRAEYERRYTPSVGYRRLIAVYDEVLAA